MGVKLRQGDDNQYSDAPFEGRVRKQDPGIAGWWQGVTGGASDLFRGLFNGIGGVEDFLSSRPQGTTRRGNDLFGPDGDGYPDFDEVDRRASARLRGQRGVRGNSPVEERQGPMGFLDFLAMAQGLLGDGGGPDYSALIARLKQNAAEGDARLASMYGALQSDIAGKAPGIAQTFDTAGAGYAQSADQASADINNAYQASRDAQSQQLAALGIGDAAGVLAAQGGFAGADQAHNVSGVARAEQASADQNTANKATALDYNTAIGSAIGQQSGEQRSALEQQLQNKLAELESEQASSQQDNRLQSISLAFQLAQNAGLVDPNAAPDIMAELEAQQAAADLYNAQLNNQKLASQLGGPVGGNLASYQQLAQQYGIDPSNLEEFLKFVEVVNSTQ